jgi:hypothetical protein
MITVFWQGRLGNQLFEYALGRILAENLGYCLRCSPLEGFIVTQDDVPGSFIGSQVTLTGQHIDLSFVNNNKGKLGFILNGWFQRYEYYQPFKEKVRGWFNRDRKRGSVELNPRDILIHIRRPQEGWIDTKVDYLFKDGLLRIENDEVKCRPGMVPEGQVIKANQDLLPFEYYAEILDSQFFDRLFIVTDCPSDPFLSYFDRYHPQIISGEILDDFNIVRSASRIVMSMSTFSWWSAFLSDAECIYMPVPDYAAWGPKSPVDLKVTDESRYQLIPVKRNGGTFF